MQDYMVVQDGPQSWQVWTCKPITGDRLEFMSDHSSKASASAAIKRYRAADQRRKEQCAKR